MATVLGRQFKLRRRPRSVGIMLVCGLQVAVGLAMAETKVLSRGTTILFS
ncbi:hypothetical protein Hanom_Chr16g01427851 [Helianthus anomalus]